MAGVKQQLTLARWNVTTGQAEASPDKFTVLLNPAEYTRNKKLCYVPGENHLDRVAPEVLTLSDLVFDGTGVVAPPNGAVPQSVDAQLLALQAVVSDPMTGKAVGMPVVELLWGSLYFVGRLAALDVRYTLFKPSGEPLRARVTLKFNEYEVDYGKHKTRALAANANSTRVIEARAGSTLPLMCFDAGQDMTKYQEVARANGLTSCRNVAPGTMVAIKGGH